MNLFEKILVINIIDILELLKNGYIILTIMAILGVLLSDKKSSSMISWIFTIIIFPFLGPLLYFSVGIDWRKRQRLNQMRENYRNIVLDIFENKLVKHDATKLFKETGKKKTEREIKHELNHLKLDERSQKVSRMLYKTDKSYI
ncbi:MAG: PLD nuclease N-terminal domain-containing protein, partial [Leptotrichiaceae bacterium]